MCTPFQETNVANPETLKEHSLKVDRCRDGSRSKPHRPSASLKSRGSALGPAEVVRADVKELWDLDLKASSVGVGCGAEGHDSAFRGLRRCSGRGR